MKKIIFYSMLIINFVSNAQWQNLNTGINDNLKGLVFFEENGLLAGENGLYYTTNGGSGASSWSEFHITNNTAISEIYENTKFTHCSAKKSIIGNSGDVYACGFNTVNNLVVIFKISLPSMSYELKHYGVLSGKINKLDYNISYNYFIGVGDNGLIINFNDTYIRNLSSMNITENLNSVYIQGFNDTFSFCSNNKIWKTDFYGNYLFNTFIKNTPNSINKDIDEYPNNYFYAIGGDKYSYSNIDNSTGSTYCDNFYKPLDANCIFYRNSIFVGTDHGIYKNGNNSNFANEYLEWMVSSQNFNISEFWGQTSSSVYYACGLNGVVLKHNNTESATKPYVKLDVNGTCVGNSLLLKAFTGSGISASWYVNGQLVGTGLSGVNYNFNTTGSYLIEVTVQNSFGQVSQDSKTINIVSLPAVNKPITISDLILCKEESIQIQISNSEPNVIYTLKKEGPENNSYGDSDIGNGGNVNINSNLIDTTGNYFIEAKNVLANCSTRFTNSFLITVEKTKADFHCDLINANVNEVVSYYNKSEEAQNFNWTLSSSFGNQNFNGINIQNSFSVSGQTTVTLDASSSNNCHDILTKNEPFVVEQPLNQNNCFLLVKSGNDIVNNGNFEPEIADLKPASDGFLTCGKYNNEIFNSKQGISYNLTNKKGCYLAKYDFNGVLKWMVYTKNLSNSNINNDIASSCVQDSNGNIYFTGYSGSVFFDNSGKAFNLSLNGYSNGFLIKLNSKGEFIWKIQIGFSTITGVDIDNNNNLVLQTKSIYGTLEIGGFGLFFNGNFVQNIGQSVATQETSNRIVKISSTGAYIWDAAIEYNTNDNNGTVLGVKFDSFNNYYLALWYTYTLDIYSAGSNVSVTIPSDGTSGGQKLALLKFNENGILQWKMKSATVDLNGNALYVDGTFPSDFHVDTNGDVYISGSNYCYGYVTGAGNRHVFENTDGSTTFTTKGTYFLAKISTNGICEWIRSAGNTYYGFGHNVLKSGNEIFVTGQYSDDDVESLTAEFDSTDEYNYNLNINKSDYFIAVYDTVGNLKRIVVNGQNQNLISSQRFVNLIKAPNDSFYLAKIFVTYIGASIYTDFGQVVPNSDETDGSVLRFKEECGITVYNRSALSLTSDNNISSLITIAPNPTSNQFVVNLNRYYDDIELEIYDIYGKKIKSESFKNSNLLKSNIEATSGVYLVKTTINKEIVNWSKLIKE